MKLAVLTAVSRPWNLNVIAGSLATALARAPVDLTWHLRFDPLREHVGGQALKNEMLDGISDGWVWILDDDTLVHERFLEVVAPIADAHPHLDAIVVSQRRNDGRVLQASAEKAVLGEIDAGQAILSRAFIANYRIPETYAGDGVWLETLLHDRDSVVYEESVLSLHNVLSGLEVSEPPERMGA